MESATARLQSLRDPLLERDYVRLCSRPATFRNRSLAALAVGVVFLCIFGAASEWETNDKIGKDLHFTFTWLASLYVWGLATSEAAVAIPTERSTGALTVLLTVPRTPLRLAAGFYFSRLFAALTGLLAMLPVDGAALLLGGVSLESFLLAIFLVVLSGAWGAAVGLWSGYAAPTHRHALGRSGFVILTVVVLVPMLIMTVPLMWTLYFGQYHEMNGRVQTACQWAAGSVFVSSPLGALSYFTGTNFFGAFLGNWVYVIPLGVTLLFSVGAIYRTGTRLRDDTERTLLAGGGPGPVEMFRRILGRWRSPPPTPTVAPAAPPADPVSPGASAPAALAPVVVLEAPPLPPPRAATRVWSHPLWWKESRPPRSAWQRLALWLGFAGYFWFLSYMFFSSKLRDNLISSGRPTAFYDVLITVPLWILVLGSTAACTTFLAEERERMSLDHLRTAPLGPLEFILARIVATAVRIWPVLAMSLLFIVVGLITGQIHFTALVAWAIGFIPVAAFLPLLSFRLGMKAQTVRGASRKAAIVLGSVLAVWPIGTACLAGLFDRYDDEIFATLGANPLVAAVSPFLLWCHWIFGGMGENSLRFARIGCVSLFLWGFLAWRIWKGLPRALEEAFHAGEEG